jgi:hypothetical protein
MAGGEMVKVIIYSICLVLIFAVSGSTAAESSALPDRGETTDTVDGLKRNSSNYYRLMTLPSTNRKKVDAMCIRFLSLIPKARLIPTTEERTVYRLVAGTFATIESAKKRKAELAQHGGSPFVVGDDTGYSVIAASQLTESLALAEQQRLAARKITTTIRELRLPLKEWQMKSNESFVIRDAVILAGRLAKIGVITILEPAAD